LRLLFSYVAFMIGVPGHSLSKDLIAAESGTEIEGDEGRILANLSPEVLNILESVADVGSSDSTSSPRASRVYMVAGTGELGFKGDGELATRAHLWFATAVAVDAGGNIVIADSFNNRVRRVDARTGKIQTVAGMGKQGFFGDGDLATKAQLNSPSGVAVDHQGNIFIADTFNNRIRVVDARTGIISTLAGTGKQGSSGDDGLAVRATLAGPSGLAIDEKGNLLIADSGNHRIRKLVRAKNIIAAVAGTGVAGQSGDGGLGMLAELNTPSGVAVDRNGNTLIADTVNNRVRRVDAESGIISTVVGTGDEGFDGDGGIATLARLMQPSGITVDNEGGVYVSDTFNNRIRRVDPVSGIITTLAGTDMRGHSLNGMIAALAPLSNPVGIARDLLGNLVVADSGNHCILRIMP
jgi:sugar lactone lactonase YvrE